MNGPSMFEEDDEFVDPGDEEAMPDEAHQAMDAMMDHYLDTMDNTLESGQVMTVPIIAIQGDQVLADTGAKAEGVIDVRELLDAEGKLNYKVGDKIEVVVKGTDRDTGMVLLSHAEARRREALQQLEDAFNAGAPVRGRVVRAVKGGLIVDFGTTAFMPASQIDLRRTENFEPYVAQPIECMVLEFAPKNRRIIVSRRKLLEHQQEQKRRELLDKLSEGQVIDARVKRIVDFGAFVDMGGIDGLIPRGEISWHRTAKPDEYLHADEQIQVKVLNIDRNEGKITLSRRQMTSDPWEEAIQTYPVGSIVKGKIVSLTNYGAFVRIAEGLDGMIHINDMAWDAVGKKPADFVSVGQDVEAMVLNVDPEQKRISLGIKQLGHDPWEEITRKYPEGTTVKGTVTGLKKYGAFVELEPGIKGMVHVSDFAWDRHVEEPREVVQKGQEIEARVLSIDTERRRISLGVKQMTKSPTAEFSSQHKVGDTVEGKVTEVSENGVQVKLSDQIQGFIHVSQLDSRRVENPSEVCKVGDTLKAEIVKINPRSNDIRLSRRQFLKNEDQRNVQGYMKTSSDMHAGPRLGELLADISLEDEPPSE